VANSVPTGPRSFDSCKADGTPPEILVSVSASDRLISVPGVDGGGPVKLSGYVFDPSAAYESKSNWGSTAYASTKLAIDVVKESSDVFTPLKSVAGGLSAVLKHYDVWYTYLATPYTSFMLVELASDGESPNSGITDTPRRWPRRVPVCTCS